MQIGVQQVSKLANTMHQNISKVAVIIVEAQDGNVGARDSVLNNRCAMKQNGNQVSEQNSYW